MSWDRDFYSYRPVSIAKLEAKDSNFYGKCSVCNNFVHYSKLIIKDKYEQDAIITNICFNCRELDAVAKNPELIAACI